jgi:hypothetical protein
MKVIYTSLYMRWLLQVKLSRNTKVSPLNLMSAFLVHHQKATSTAVGRFLSSLLGSASPTQMEIYEKLKRPQLCKLCLNTVYRGCKPAYQQVELRWPQNNTHNVFSRVWKHLPHKMGMDVGKEEKLSSVQ